MSDASSENDLPVVDLSSPCRHLRSKGMYVYTDSSMGHDPYGDDDTTAYWCLRSMTSFGPDDEVVGRSACCNPSRSCYEAI
ncbi:MAG: hypothetical protein IRY99_04600 [Isosphaeraceae bacterium]|nr:hypothetical protein [Isosphaeraceae bacterium]